MVDRQIILETIKKMRVSGLDDTVIIATLKDVGLSESEIKGFFEETAGGKPVSAAAPERKGPAAPLFEDLSSKSVQSAPFRQSGSQTPEESHAENVLLHTTTHAVLEDSSLRLDELARKLGSMEQKMGSVANLPVEDLSQKIVHFEKKVSELDKDLVEIKAQTKALRDVMEKILDTDRQILQELESKKE